MKRYKQSLPNWALTDHYRFIFIREGDVVARVALAQPDATAARPVDVDALADAFGAYLDYSTPVLRTPQRLAQELARRARLLRAGLLGLLEAEPTSERLRGVLAFYRQTLMRDMSDADFADTFAQTIAYGMFLGRLAHQDGAFDRRVAVAAIPQSIPFLRSAVRLLTDEDLLPAAVVNLLDDLAAVLDNTEVAPIRDEVAAGGLERDLVVYFYERFLEQYDKGERQKRGVYYTPPELVGYLTRATQDVLKDEFGLHRGLADPSVILLDPAVGTGTFVLGMAEGALAEEEPRGTASQKRLIREHLLHNFVGFELLPAPYAIAHLKLASFFEQFGYQLGAGERLPIYLTNSLELSEIGAGAQLGLPMVAGIVDEAREAGRVKSHSQVLVIVGNPPYERTSHNANEHSDRLIEDFFTIDGRRIGDRNAAPIRDDYLRFIRWSVWKLLEQANSPGHGVLAFVTNRRFLEGVLFRAVRRFLLDRFDEINVFDLHGDQREWYGDRIDDKVFKDVQAGIALTVFVKRPGPQQGPARVRYREAWGTRADKLLECQQAALTDDAWRDLEPREPLHLFVPYYVPSGYDSWPTVAQLFPRRVTGVQTHRDQLVVARSRDELERRMSRLADLNVPDEQVAEQFELDLRESGWNLRETRRSLEQRDAAPLLRWTYRPFDRRWVAFDERLVDRTRTEISPHLVGRADNVALAFAYGSLTDGPYALVARSPVPAAALSWRTFGQAHFAPLWLHDEALGQSVREANLPPGLLDRLAAAGIVADPESVLAYVYAILNGPDYRARYADGLRYAFPRVPLAGDPQTFAAVTEIGERLIALHLLEHGDLDTEAPRMDGDDRAVLQAPVYDDEAQQLTLGADLTAHPISAAMWGYRQGSYRVLSAWLTARAGSPLSAEEFAEFGRVAAAVKLTLRELPELDRRIAEAAASALPLGALGLEQEIG